MKTMTRKYWGALATASLLVVSVLFQGQPIGAMPLSVATPISGDACNLFCADEPVYCPPDQHDAFFSDTPQASGLNHNGQVCWAGTCDAMHPYCEGLAPNQALESMRLAVLRNDSRAVRTLLAEYGSLSLNRARSAIQMTACDRSIVLHMPIPTLLLKGL